MKSGEMILIGAVAVAAYYFGRSQSASGRGMGFTGWRQQWAKETGLDWHTYWGRPDGESHHDWRNDPNRAAWHNARRIMGYERYDPQSGSGGGEWDHRAYSMYE